MTNGKLSVQAGRHLVRNVLFLVAAVALVSPGQGAAAQPDVVVMLAEAMSYVKRRARAKEPFFLCFPLAAPHKPVLPRRRFVGATKAGPSGDFVKQVDHLVESQVARAAELEIAFREIHKHERE